MPLSALPAVLRTKEEKSGPDHSVPIFLRQRGNPARLSGKIGTEWTGPDFSYVV